MDEKHKRQGPIVSARTSDRVAEMSDELRADIARDLAGRRDTVPDQPVRRRLTTPYEAGRRADTADAEVEAPAARIAADLHRTERRLYQLERGSTSSRYQMHEGGPPSGRYARLLRRAEQLERQLRALR
jgi:hypothetical protein